MSTANDIIANLFAAYGNALRQRARRILGSDADADDAVQEVMLTLLNGPDVLPTIERVAGWLFTLVRRRCIDIIRSDARRKVREAAEGVAGLFDGADDPAALMEQREVAELVAAAVDELPEAERYAFVANALDGLTFREMAEHTGVPMGTLMARKKRAVDTIRNQMRRRGILPPNSGASRHSTQENAR